MPPEPPSPEAHTAQRPIFRPEAMRRYASARDQVAVPCHAGAPRLGGLYALLALFVISGSLMLCARIEMSVAGHAAVMGSGRRAAVLPEAQIAVFFSPQSHARTQSGQTVSLRLAAPPRTVRGSIAKVLPGIVNADQAQALFALDPGMTSRMAFPATAILVSPEPGQAGAFNTGDNGKLHAVNIDLESRRMFTFFPLLNRLGGGVP